jgi:hypothetical protein
MTKKELQNSLDKIQPREDLVNKTIMQMKEHKAREGRRFSLPRYSQGMRLAGALCAFALVFSFGFAMAKQNHGVPAERTLADLAAVAAETIGTSNPVFEAKYTDGYILVNGNIASLSFIALTEDDISSNAVHRCKVIVNAEKLVEISNELSVDLNQTRESFEAEIVFYDESTMNAFFNQSMHEMLLCLVPDANGNWTVSEFSHPEK